MHSTIYLDILICLNIFINYFLLLAVVKFNKGNTRKRRLILGAIIGSLTSLIIMLPPLTSFMNFIIKLIIALFIVLVTFGFKTAKTYIKNVLLFYLVTFLFCGVMIGYWFIFTPSGMVINNSTVYFNISPSVIIVSTLISYLIVWLINKYVSIKMPKKVFCKLKIINEDKTCELNAKIDTGNSLKEPFSLSPVIVIQKEDIESIIPFDIFSFLNENSKDDIKALKGIRFIPFKTVNSNGLMPAFKPDKLFIDDKECLKETYIAISQNKNFTENYKALINIECLE